MKTRAARAVEVCLTTEIVRVSSVTIQGSNKRVQAYFTEDMPTFDTYERGGVGKRAEADNAADGLLRLRAGGRLIIGSDTVNCCRGSGTQLEVLATGDGVLTVGVWTLSRSRSNIFWFAVLTRLSSSSTSACLSWSSCSLCANVASCRTTLRLAGASSSKQCGLVGTGLISNQMWVFTMPSRLSLLDRRRVKLELVQKNQTSLIEQIFGE
ncbi:hypothetical protein BpHYR1_011124 [Brachionus plicatilis]|uniref:Uncharacterized protein n=1 Tax=Brachionus plicatilis TaxID=10195 RepID=A0A3M7P4J7_BRAPC|nr:hypothetical protein BpHYR1_011124 [Brachionus plicatilis]